MKKICKKCNEMKLLSDFNAHKGMTDGRLNKCKACHSKYCKEYYSKNKDVMNKQGAEYRANNKEKVAEYISKWQKKNPHKCSANSLKYKNANKEKVRNSNKRYSEKNKEKLSESWKKYRLNNRDKLTAYQKKWNQRNQGLRIAQVAKRRAAKLKATVAWGDKESIDSIYAMSSFLTFATFGNGYHVDHIIPLQGRKVCGLHVESNLQIMRAEDNLSKGNRV